MKLTPAERETIILYDEAGDTANVYTYDHKLIEKLSSFTKSILTKSTLSTLYDTAQSAIRCPTDA